ncbi:hypothetical protein THAOC_37599 [Thalassiosira oceanica]|uniref:Uncharacterized protein n=1 Tax=Thalassiosira oceanica TaxID=159749 RepID=K0QYK8_THAOC|nr:hypothetical protein THAOC_37599 [Thalassiosira oceanica]|eukprot:EJK43910.1 hypothetical protein THAOC_37599 [Thalassiosira oceanica]
MTTMTPSPRAETSDRPSPVSPPARGDDNSDNNDTVPGRRTWGGRRGADITVDVDDLRPFPPPVPRPPPPPTPSARPTPSSQGESEGPGGGGAGVVQECPR